MTPPVSETQSDEVTVTDEARRILIRALRVVFPHESLPDGPYERTADGIIEAANASTWLRVTLVQGLRTLDGLAGDTFVDVDDDTATKVLTHVEGTEFFGFIRRTAVVSLYDDPEVWEALGYEGPSFDEGGYVDRGFDDLDWLPDPRVEEYSGDESLVEVAPGLPGASTAAADTSDSAGPTPEASHPGLASQQAQEVSTTEAQ